MMNGSMNQNKGKKREREREREKETMNIIKTTSCLFGGFCFCFFGFFKNVIYVCKVKKVKIKFLL